MRKDTLAILFVITTLESAAVAAGPPCWDEVPPAKKYLQRHIVSGSNSQLSVDGLTVSAIRKDNDRAIVIQLSVTNCSPNAVQVTPDAYDLVVVGPGGPEADKKLARLDPTQFPHPNNPRRNAPALRPETLEYGRIGTYFLFFAPDIYYTNTDHTQRLPVVIGKWQLDFRFQKQAIR